MLVKTPKKRESEVADSPLPEDGRRRIQWEQERGAGRRDAAVKRSGVCSPPKKFMGHDLMSMLDQVTAFASFSMSSR